jgi:hypothetical protein
LTSDRFEPSSKWRWHLHHPFFLLRPVWGEKGVASFLSSQNELSPRNDMTTLLVAYQYPYKFILGPALIIILAITIALLMKYPSSKTR